MTQCPCICAADIAAYVKPTDRRRIKLTGWATDRWTGTWSSCRAGAGRARWGRCLDLNAFFEVTGKDPVEVTAADVFEFPPGQRALARSMIPTTARQAGGRPVCLCIASAGRDRPLLPR
jgi:hypothetical protein